MVLFLLFVLNIVTPIQNKINKTKLCESLEKNLTSKEKANVYVKLVQMSNLIDGIRYAHDGLEFCEEKLLLEQSAWFNEYLSSCYRKLGDYPKAIASIYKASDIYQKLRLFDKIAVVQVLLGSQLANAKEFHQAIPLLQNARIYYKQENDTLNLCGTLINLGETYRLIDSLHLASTHFSHCLDLCQENNSIRAYALGNLGLVHFAQDSLTLAQQELEQSLQMLAPTPDYYSQSYYQAELGKLYLLKGEAQKGDQMVREAYELALAKGLKEQISDISESLAQVYEGKGNYKEALHFNRIHHTYRDSIINLENVRKISAMRSKHEIEKREKSIAGLEMQNRSKRRFINLSLLSIVILCAACAFLYRLFLLRRKMVKAVSAKNVIISKKSEETELLLRELNHRVKNNLQLISSMFSLQSRHEEDEHVLMALKSARLRVESLSLIHQSLYKESLDKQVQLKPYIETLSQGLIYNFGEETELDLNLEDVSMSIDDIIPLGIIINELVTNSLKYSNKERISISLKHASEHILLQIQDVGQGLKEDFRTMKTTSLGLKLVGSLTKQLNATLDQRNDNGCVWELTLPN